MTNEKDLKDKLTPEEYYVTQNHGTEPAFSGKYDGVKTPGTYHCIVCGVELFSSESKYDSGSGWPSFWEPSQDENIETEQDHSPDGPQPTGLRYCINSVSLDLKPTEEE